MINWQLFTAFLLITFVLVITPGPIVTLVIATGATRGIRAALITVIGTTAGNAVLLAAIALGLSWVLKASAELFEVMRWCGVVYLIYLGVQTWRTRGGAAGCGAHRPARPHLARLCGRHHQSEDHRVHDGVPAAVRRSRPAGGPQLAAMCTMSVLLAGLIDAAWGIAAGLGRGFFLSPRRQVLLNRVSSVVLIGGGIWLSLARRPV